jgi:glutamate/tyrosine decarboxylase-like PLP-dependent enzyme
VHTRDRDTEVLTEAVIRYAVDRLGLDPPPLDRPRSAEELRAAAGTTITAEGIGGLDALRVFADVLAPACISTDHPRFLSFVPAAPTEAAALFDLVVGASALYAGSWLEGAGAVFAENEALRWLAELAGFPEDAGGVFVSGGSAGNLSALVAARYAWRTAVGDGRRDRQRGAVLASDAAHSSVRAAARVMDADIVAVEPDGDGRLTAGGLERALGGLSDAERDSIFAVVATAGTTNAGLVDDLSAAAVAAADIGVWFHVDGAYGLAALAVPGGRARFRGIERAHSFVVDPHKWLFAPFDCAALVYREPAVARAAHIQHAEYLEVLSAGRAWNPSEYAFHLTRRARGLPFWFSLAVHGTRRYGEAVEVGLTLARQMAALIEASAHLELVVAPELSIVVFRRLRWSAEQYHAWSERVLDEAVAFVVPTIWGGETVLRCCFVNPRTTVDDLRLIVDSLAEG